MAPTQRPNLRTRSVDPTHRPNMRTRQADPSHVENQLILSACRHKVDTCNEEYHEPSASQRAKPLAEPPHNEHRLQPSKRLAASIASSRAASQRASPPAEQSCNV
ncbi:hypothetical protein ACFX1R_024050 [Malus domestica]